MNNTELYELYHLNSAREKTKDVMHQIDLARDHIMDSAKILAVHRGDALVDLGEAYEKMKSALSRIEEMISTIRYC